MPVFLVLLILFFLGGSVRAQSPTQRDFFTYILNDGPASGSEKAPVTLIEFSDFQCSFCWRFWKDTLPLIKEKYIQPGKVRFFYHHFAIFGKPSTLAAQAAECAHEQGQFWPYHDKLFSQTPVPLAFTEGKLSGYARDLRLDSAAFDQCVGSGKYTNKVVAESSMAAVLGVRGTPAFFLNQQFLVGAQPFSVFAAAFENELKRPRQRGQTSGELDTQASRPNSTALIRRPISSYR